ncbi:conserved hypothetical protein [Methylocella silvestris BL2]|uniref:Uncharacterized protein n=1 Tax=Methylocella silvestris (strain DSM 15510 / CIP 108128 / LMG 27833 / NCIMB 13906 / BL2) TaxID=395965 RepID=B8EME2_METSB|nr:hypothetical protein [Methylocella silvestris]ACK52070.1 conserved hypothetical protein [Methylocella silvestris BL2]
MKTLGFAAAAALALLTPAVAAPASQTITFTMEPSPGAATCLKNARATVIDHSFGDFENLEVLVRGLPPNTDFDLFTIQVPNAPFGLAWYVGDIVTDDKGVGVGNFVGRFNVETFIVSPGAVTPPPQVHLTPPFPDATVGVKTAPIHTYHLGLWFNSPQDAKKANCSDAVTPFNGVHKAGIQVLNTDAFPVAKGPLFQLK